MIEQLFGSKTRVKLIKLFYGNPDRSFYVREITRKIDEQINSVRRELSNLLSIGIINSDTTNNKLYYEVNPKYEYYDPLLLIFGEGKKKQVKAAGSNPEPTDEFRQLGHVELIVYTGVFTRESKINADVVIVGSVNKNAVDKYISDLEKDEGKELRYVIMKKDDFIYRKQIKDRFVTQLLNAKKQVIVDSNNILKKQEI